MVLGFLVILIHANASALSSAEASVAINDAAMQLVRFCMDPKVGLNEQAVATLVDHVLASKDSKESALAKSQDCSGAYYEFDTKIAFSRFVEYSYNPLVPIVITRPSSVRYSIWSNFQGETHKLHAGLKASPSAGTPLVVRGFQRESDTPDLNTGVYHEYDLKRALILLNYKGRQVLLSVSKQVGESNVGKKGAILGNDNDWNYYYSGASGASITGLGWVKSYIYDFFSVGVYAESGTAPSGTVRAGVFQWLRAGWSGINFVKSNHILRGLRRFGQNARSIMESPRLPAPSQISSVYQSLSSMPPGELTKKYAALQQAIRTSAFQAGVISKSALDEPVSFANIPKEQMIEELMLDYLKMALGKPALLGQQLSLLPPKPLL